jgi:hypothetical protein
MCRLIESEHRAPTDLNLDCLSETINIVLLRS